MCRPKPCLFKTPFFSHELAIVVWRAKLSQSRRLLASFLKAHGYKSTIPTCIVLPQGTTKQNTFFS